MKKFKLMFRILLAILLVYIAIFIYIYQDRQIRIKMILTQNIQSLKVHYKITQRSFENTADATIGTIESNTKVANILTKFLKASKKEKILLRKELQIEVESGYKALQKLGVLQMHFINPKNITILRMHKPNKYGDDLTKMRYSVRQVNLTKRPMSGFERGKTAPSYRNVRTLYGKNGQYLGELDVSFAPEIIQKNLSEISNLQSHFIMKKELISYEAWSRNDKKVTYKVSIENSNYIEFNNNYNNNKLKSIISLAKKKKLIFNKMKNSQEFETYLSAKDMIYVISFLPIFNIENQQIAYLISYRQSLLLYDILRDFYILNFAILVVLFLIALVFYRAKLYNKKIEKEKNRYYKLAKYDTLTTLPNRPFFLKKIHQAKIKADKNGGEFGLIFIDLDNFKKINDSHGHSEGDKVLRCVAKRFKNLVRENDVVSRISGDEFVVMVEDIKDIKDVAVIAKKILKKSKEPINIGGINYYVGLSIGVAMYPADTDNVNDLIKYADTAMYRAKKSGKNNIQFFLSNMSKEIMDKVVLEAQLRKAIKNREFIVYYQPQINSKDDTLLGMEALVRWQHPTKGIIPPNEFIPIAEESGLIIELDQLVMREAMSQFASWYEKGFRPGTLALNLAMKQLQQKDFIAILKNILDETNCKSHWLEFEVTETEIMTNPEQAISALEEMSKLGIEIAVDDFGTGYSSLSYLKKLPINKLKIDQSFVRNLHTNKEDASITKTIINLAKNLDLKVLAEGVETFEQKEFLSQNRCKYIQGFLYSKPIMAKDMEDKFL